MQSHIAAQAQRIYEELQQANISSMRVKEMSAQLDALEVQSRNYSKALSHGGSADPYPSGDPADGSGFAFPRMKKLLGVGDAPRVAPPSPLQLDDQQIDALWQAARNKTPFRAEIGQKGLEHSGFMGTVRDKTSLAESNLGGQQLPPVQNPGPRGNYGLAYEPFRILSALPTVAMTGPQAGYLVHHGNTREAAAVAELGTKPDLGPLVTEAYIKPQKIAGLVSASLEILQDTKNSRPFCRLSWLVRF